MLRYCALTDPRLRARHVLALDREGHIRADLERQRRRSWPAARRRPASAAAAVPPALRNAPAARSGRTSLQAATASSSARSQPRSRDRCVAGDARCFISSAAPSVSNSASATSADDEQPRGRAPGRPAGVRDPSRSTCRAMAARCRHAGTRPKTMPAVIDRPSRTAEHRADRWLTPVQRRALSPGASCEQHRQRPVRHQHAGDAADDGQQHAFDQQLPTMTPVLAPSAAFSAISCSRSVASASSQVGDVYAGDEQDEAHRRQQDEQRRPHAAVTRIAQGLDERTSRDRPPHSGSSFVESLQARRPGRCAGLLGRDAWPQPRDDIEVVRA